MDETVRLAQLIHEATGLKINSVRERDGQFVAFLVEEDKEVGGYSSS